MRFSPNLTMLFTESSFLDRFSMASEAGFDAVEFQLPYAFEVSAVQAAAKDAGVDVVLFNLPAGDWEAGDRGIAVDPDRQNEFKDGVAQAIEYAQALDCDRLNCLAGKCPSGLSREDAHRVLLENVRYAAKELASCGLTLLVEPCNRMDIPGFFLDSIEDGVNLIREAECPNLRLQFDFYHVQRMQGELLNTFERHLDIIGHVQIADNPGRHEPGTGEIHYENVLRHVQQSAYEGCVGLEYLPSKETKQTLAWTKAF